MSRISMDRVAELLREQGVEALVEETGGGVATIFAGPTWTHGADGTRYACVAGIGTYDEGRSVAWTEDFCWGADGDVGHETWASPGMDARRIADGIASTVRVSVAAHLRAAECLGIDVDTAPADADLAPEESEAARVLAATILSPATSTRYLLGFTGWDVRPYAQRDGEPTEIDVVVYGEFSHDVPVFEGSASTAYDFLNPGRYEVRVAGLPLFTTMVVTDDWSGIDFPARAA